MKATHPALPGIAQGHWLEWPDGDARAACLYRRHYSCRPYQDGRRQDPRNRNRNLIVGPGEKLVLFGADGQSLFVWRRFIDMANQAGVNCAVFRNEGRILSSELIRQADVIAFDRWPGYRHYTYVNPRRIRSTNPGCCFLKAGWHRCGTTRRGLLILERLP